MVRAISPPTRRLSLHSCSETGARARHTGAEGRHLPDVTGGSCHAYYSNLIMVTARGIFPATNSILPRHVAFNAGEGVPDLCG